MRNKFTFIIFLILVNTKLYADNLFIESKNITFDKNSQISIFENDVKVKTEDGNIIKSDFAEYNKLKKIIVLKNNITAIDDQNNIIEAQLAEYDDNLKILKSFGDTKITTSEKYTINGSDMILDNNKKSIESQKSSTVTDQENNRIYLENFKYETINNIFKSIGFVKIEDKLNNIYEFSQIYIDTKTKEILGSDTKAFMNDDNLKINSKNKPRIFANTLQMSEKQSKFNKSIFTLCDYRENDKCPPWTIQATEMLHDSKKKTIYYDNALIKVYDIPIFYIPRLSHPDPTVDRRSGFLPPSFSDTKNLGSGLSVPYFWALSDDKNLTFTNKFYITENPLFLGEYHQAFKSSNLLADFGYTEGYKKNNSKKKPGDKSHFFSKLVKNFEGKDKSDNSLSLLVQNVSNDKYLKLYKINSDLVDYNTSTLENSIDFTHENDDIFFGFNASIYETLEEGYNDKYEYILPDVTIDKNLVSNQTVGNLDLQTNYKIRKYDTNKFTNFFVNDLNWKFKEINFNSGFKSKILGQVKNINYETKNVNLYKKDTTSEVFGALGYLTDINLQKNNALGSHLLKPKFLIRYSPGSMRKEAEGSKLNPINAFSLNRLDNINNFETGLSGTVGFEYNIEKNNKKFDFSVAQIINKIENKKMAEETSLDEKLSDFVGSANYEISDKINLNYNFSVDQNYSELNYSEIGSNFNFDPFKLDFSYLLEDKHIGDQEYFKTKLDIAKGKDGLFSFETKRNLLTNSAEFYNLSYEYLNDCLRAGLVYRREFYKDSELEPENSLMFKITLTPFGNINTPSFAQ